ncbi:MAG: hypothetical protein ACRD20_18185 [Terriglobales bacterium]
MKKKRAGKRAAKARATKKPDVKAPKRRRFVAGLIAGKSMRRSALDAGYTQSMANNAGREIMPGARKEFKQEILRKIPHAKLIRRLVQGLDAKETKLVQFEGKISDYRHLVSFRERRRYVELIAKLLGYLTEKVELSGPEETPSNLELHVHFVKSAKQKLLEKCGLDAVVETPLVPPTEP